MIIKQIPVGPMENFSYIVADKKGGNGFIIDPAWDADAILEKAKEDDITITHIIDTHHHADHVNANHLIKEATGAKLVYHTASSDFIAENADITVEDNQILNIGEMEVKILYTPGHSVGSICILVDNNLFTGDTLFVEGCGRTDFADSSADDMNNSLERIKSLDDKTKVFPGHNYGVLFSATIAELKKINPFLQGRLR